MCVCVSSDLQACRCLCWELWVQRALIDPLPLPGSTVAILQATMEFPQTPFFIMQNFSLPQRHRERRQAVGSLAHPNPLTCFSWTFNLLLLLMEELLRPVMAELRRRKLPPDLDHFSPFPPWWLRFGFVNLIPPLCMWVTPPWSLLTTHALAIKLKWIYRHLGDKREKDIPEGRPDGWEIQAVLCYRRRCCFQWGTDFNIAWWCH